jgi:excisionase family DNA binding protein
VAEEDIVTTEAESGIVLPATDLSVLLDLGRLLEPHAEAALAPGPDGEQAQLPEEIYQVLVRVFEALRKGKAITILPRAQPLTTQETADVLGVSRPALVKLINQGKILYDQSGRHRRVVFSGFRRYVEQAREARPAAPDLIAEDDDSDVDLYGVRPENYAAALKKARKDDPGPDVS